MKKRTRIAYQKQKMAEFYVATGSGEKDAIQPGGPNLLSEGGNCGLEKKATIP